MSAYDEALLVLRRGGVVAAPTETLIGLLADARSASAVERVLSLKGRSEAQTVGLIAPDLSCVASLAHEFSAETSALAERFWPGPLTLVLKAKEGLHPALVRDGMVAIRVPSESPALALCRAFGGPLTATSANLAGEPPAASTRALERSIREKVDLVFEGSSPGGPPSTIARIDAQGFTLLREGAVRGDELEAALSKL